MVKSGSRSRKPDLWQRFWRAFFGKREVIDREYIEGETADEIEAVNFSDAPDKAERPIPHYPEGKKPEKAA